MKILMMAASVRNGSVNKKLIKLAATLTRALYCEVDLADFDEFAMPVFDANLLEQKGLPEGTQKFIARMKAADGVIISSPEYNFSTPGTLKNLIDWVSREQPMPWKNRKILLMSASPSLVGGNRGLWQTRIPLECCGSFVFPDMFSLANAYEAFTADGELKDQALQKRFQNNNAAFLQYVRGNETQQ